MKIIPGSVADQLMRNKPAFLDGINSRSSCYRDAAEQQRRTHKRDKAGPYASELLAAYLDQQANESEDSCLAEQHVQLWPSSPTAFSKPVAVNSSQARRAAVLCLERVTEGGDVEIMSDSSRSISSSSAACPSPTSLYRKDGSLVKPAIRTRRGSDESNGSSSGVSSMSEGAAVRAMVASSVGDRPPALLLQQQSPNDMNRVDSDLSVEARVGSVLVNQSKCLSHRRPTKTASSSSDGSSKIPAAPSAVFRDADGFPVWSNVDEVSEEGEHLETHGN